MKKVLSLVLVAVMMMAMLAGCGGGNKETQAPGGSSAAPSQGETQSAAPSGETKTLEFTATRPVGEDGSVFILMPQNLRVVDSGICYTARNRNGTTGDLIVRVPLHFDTDTITRQIHFELIDSNANDKLT